MQQPEGGNWCTLTCSFMDTSSYTYMQPANMDACIQWNQTKQAVQHIIAPHHHQYLAALWTQPLYYYFSSTFYILYVFDYSFFS